MKIKQYILSNSHLEKLARIPYNFFKSSKGSILTAWLKIVGFSNGKNRLRLHSYKESNKIIQRMLSSDKPFMIGRYGGTEFSNLTVGGKDYLHQLCFLAGFFPENLKLLPKFKKIYLEDSKKIDVLGVWLYKSQFKDKKKIVRKLNSLKEIIPVDVLNPMHNNWINSLEGKRVLVINCFKKSIEYQYYRMDRPSIIPNFKSLEVLESVNTNAGNTDKRFKDWFEALTYLKKEVFKRKNKFDVALIASGCYSLPLAAYIKSMGKQAIHMGGVLQLLFGIKGKRWRNEVFPDNWINLLEEAPPKLKEFEKVEKGGGCYY